MEQNELEEKILSFELDLQGLGNDWIEFSKRTEKIVRQAKELSLEALRKASQAEDKAEALEKRVEGLERMVRLLAQEEKPEERNGKLSWFS